MEFINSQNEEQLNKLDLMLCPICNRTVPDIIAFVDPTNNNAYVSIKCEYQKNIAVIPLEKFLNEYALFESEMNKKLIPDIESMNKYKIKEDKGLNEEEIMKLEHLKINNCNGQCNFHENDTKKGTNYCGNCSKRLCNDCYVEHQYFDDSHFILNHELELVKKCNEHPLESINYQCKSCFSFYCEKCIIKEAENGDKKKKNCSFCNSYNKDEILIEYMKRRNEIKRKKNWIDIQAKYEKKKKEVDDICQGLISEFDLKIKQIVTEKENFIKIVNEHKKTNDMLFALIKVLYSNFKKSRIYQNFHIINNYDNNTNFDEAKYNPYNDKSDIKNYRKDITQFLTAHPLLKSCYNTFYIKQKEHVFVNQTIQSVLWNQHINNYSCLLTDNSNENSKRNILWHCATNNSNTIEPIFFEKEIFDVVVLDDKYLIGYDRTNIYLYEFQNIKSQHYIFIETITFPNTVLKKIYNFNNTDSVIYFNCETDIKGFIFKSNKVGIKRFKDQWKPSKIKNQCNAICLLSYQKPFLAYNDKNTVIIENFKNKNLIFSEADSISNNNSHILDIFLTTTESKEKEKENLIFVSHSDSIIVYSFLEKNESIQQKVYLTYSSICNFYQLGSSLLLGVDSYEGFDGNNKNVLIEFGYRTQNSDNFYINFSDINLNGKKGFLIEDTYIKLFTSNSMFDYQNLFEYQREENAKIKPILLDK